MGAERLTYTVAGMRCSHCEAALRKELGLVAGVENVDVDLAAKTVTIRGCALDDETLRAAIDEAGYEAA